MPFLSPLDLPHNLDLRPSWQKSECTMSSTSRPAVQRQTFARRFRSAVKCLSRPILCYLSLLLTCMYAPSVAVSILGRPAIIERQPTFLSSSRMTPPSSEHGRCPTATIKRIELLIHLRWLLISKPCRVMMQRLRPQLALTHLPRFHNSRRRGVSIYPHTAIHVRQHISHCAYIVADTSPRL